MEDAYEEWISSVVDELTRRTMQATPTADALLLRIVVNLRLRPMLLKERESLFLKGEELMSPARFVDELQTEARRLTKASAARSKSDADPQK